MKILVYGYGNPGRQDDCLGIKFTEFVEKWSKEHSSLRMDTDMNYQLNIEDSLTISEYDIVFFVDASMEVIDDYLITKVTPSEKVNFSMHTVSPSYITYLCNEIYDQQPLVFLIHIKGYEWELQEGITEKANQNLQNALVYFQGLMQNSRQLSDIIEQI